MRRLVLAAALALAATPAAAAERIVSLGGAITEILYALGEGPKVVARDTTNSYPDAAWDLPDVGYVRQLSAEPILSFTPDLVVATDQAAPRTALDQVASAGTPVVLIPDVPSVEGTLAKIRAVAAAVGKEAEGEALAADTERSFTALAEALTGVEGAPEVLFILTASSGALLAAGEHTAADALIELAGGRNAVQGYEGYKPLSPESATAMNPAIVLVTAHGLPMLGGVGTLAKRPDLGLIPAVQEGRILVVDAGLFLQFGPRAPHAVAELAQRLHPDLSQP
ncbi:MAG TPA: ABC transporter substrate-binding protein [Kiloniellales bacterium]|nr:ABC transporter substrate-binding protein [Kiloniellales bacterium]